MPTKNIDWKHQGKLCSIESHDDLIIISIHRQKIHIYDANNTSENKSQSTAKVKFVSKLKCKKRHSQIAQK